MSIIKHFSANTPEELSEKLQVEVNEKAKHGLKLKHFEIIKHDNHFDLIAHFKTKCKDCGPLGKDSCHAGGECHCSDEKHHGPKHHHDEHEHHHGPKHHHKH